MALSILSDAPAEAVTLLEPVRKSRPSDRAVLVPLANAYRSVGRVEEARSLLESLTALDPTDARAFLELGLLELEAGSLAAAEASLRRASALAPEEPAVLLGLSRCFLLLGRNEEARQYREKFEAAQIRLKLPWATSSAP